MVGKRKVQITYCELLFLVEAWIKKKLLVKAQFTSSH